MSQSLMTMKDRWNIANTLAESNLLPKQFQNNTANVFVALELADQLSTMIGSMSSFSIMSNLYVVHGTVGFSSKFMIALANECGKFDVPLDWEIEGKGDGLLVTCYSYRKGKKLQYSVSYEMARREGWTKNPKYQSMPELMLRYRSASAFVRFFAPEVLMGMYSSEELETKTVDITETVVENKKSDQPEPTTNGISERSQKLLTYKNRGVLTTLPYQFK